MEFEDLRTHLDEVEESIKKLLEDANNKKFVLIKAQELAKIAHERRVFNLRKDQQPSNPSGKLKGSSMEEVMRRERQKATRQSQIDDVPQIHTWQKKSVSHGGSSISDGASKLIQRMEDMSLAQNREFEKKIALLEVEGQQQRQDIGSKLAAMLELLSLDPVSPSRKDRECSHASHGKRLQLALYPTAVRRVREGSSCAHADTAEAQALAASNPFFDHFEHQREDMIHSQGRESLHPAIAISAGGEEERGRLDGVNAQVAQRVWRAVSNTGVKSIGKDQANAALVLYLQAAEQLLPPLVEMGLQAAVVAAVDKAAPSHPVVAQQLQADWRMTRPILHRGCASIVRGALAKAEAGALASRFVQQLDRKGTGTVLREEFEDLLFDALAAIISPTAIVAVIQYSLGLPASEVVLPPLSRVCEQFSGGGEEMALGEDGEEERWKDTGLGGMGSLWLEGEGEEGLEGAFTPRTRRLLYPQEDIF